MTGQGFRPMVVPRGLAPFVPLERRASVLDQAVRRSLVSPAWRLAAYQQAHARLCVMWAATVRTGPREHRGGAWLSGLDFRAQRARTLDTAMRHVEDVMEQITEEMARG